MNLLFFSKENFVIIKYNKNSHISSLVNSNTRSKKKEKNIPEFKTELNKKFYRRKFPTFVEPTIIQ